MNLSNLKPFLYFIPLAVVQLTIIPLISVSNITPNLIFVLIAFYTLRFGQVYGTVLGFLLGLIFDIASGGLIGASMFSFTLSAFFVGYFYSENKIDLNTASFFFLFILVVCASINAFVFAAVSNSNTNISFFYLLLFEGLLPGMYTALFGLPMVIIAPRKGII